MIYHREVMRMARFYGTATGTEGGEPRTWTLGPYDSIEDAQRDGQEIVDNPTLAFFEPYETVNAIEIYELEDDPRLVGLGRATPVFEWTRN
jgi:hypothetical protein